METTTKAPTRPSDQRDLDVDRNVVIGRRRGLDKTARVDVCMFSTRTYDRASFVAAAGFDRHNFRFVDAGLIADTVPLAEGCEAVCAFVNDDVGGATLQRLAAAGVRHVALRSAGFNHVDLSTARELGIAVVREIGRASC